MSRLPFFIRLIRILIVTIPSVQCENTRFHFFSYTIVEKRHLVRNLDVFVLT